MMNKYLLCIGSNTDRELNVGNCRMLLSGLYSNILFSEVIETQAIGEGYAENFLNQLVVIETDDEKNIVDKHLTEIETKLGRLSTDKSKGIVKIDVDLLAQNNVIIKNDDFRRPYISLLLKKIDYPALAY